MLQATTKAKALNDKFAEPYIYGKTLYTKGLIFTTNIHSLIFKLFRCFSFPKLYLVMVYYTSAKFFQYINGYMDVVC